MALIKPNCWDYRECGAARSSETGVPLLREGKAQLSVPKARWCSKPRQHTFKACCPHLGVYETCKPVSVRKAPIESTWVLGVGALPQRTPSQPAYLFQPSQRKEVSRWGCSTQETIPGLCGRTSCLGAGSAGNRCPSSPRLQHNGESVDLKRSRERRAKGSCHIIATHLPECVQWNLGGSEDLQHLLVSRQKRKGKGP